jgi:hypothetical protein
MKESVHVLTMDATAELFDVVDEHPKAGLIRELKHAKDQFLELHAEHGGLFTQAQIAALTSLSKQRIHQLMDDGTFRRIFLRSINGEVLGTYVSLADVLAWLKANPQGYRRSAWPKVIAGALDTSVQAA